MPQRGVIDNIVHAYILANYAKCIYQDAVIMICNQILAKLLLPSGGVL